MPNKQIVRQLKAASSWLQNTPENIEPVKPPPVHQISLFCDLTHRKSPPINSIWETRQAFVQGALHLCWGYTMSIQGALQSGDAQSLDIAAQTMAEKFNLSLDKAKRLIELYRLVLARELNTTKRRYR